MDQLLLAGIHNVLLAEVKHHTPLGMASWHEKHYFLLIKHLQRYDFSCFNYLTPQQSHQNVGDIFATRVKNAKLAQISHWVL